MFQTIKKIANSLFSKKDLSPPVLSRFLFDLRGGTSSDGVINVTYEQDWNNTEISLAACYLDGKICNFLFDRLVSEEYNLYGDEKTYFRWVETSLPIPDDILTQLYALIEKERLNEISFKESLEFAIIASDRLTDKKLSEKMKREREQGRRNRNSKFKVRSLD